MPARSVWQENCISNKIIDRATERIAAINDKLSRSNGRKKSSIKIKPLTIIAYTVTFFVVIGIISSGYTKANGPKALANATIIDSSKVNKTSVDDAVAASVAASVAQVTNLPVSTSVVNLSMSTQAMSEFKQTEGASVSKPQIIESTIENRSVISYTVVSGDTVTSLAAKFNVTKETIKWANNLTSDTINPGVVLKILPVSGILYNVKSSDTIDSIASKYKVDPTQLVLYNDLDVSGVVANTSIILPSGILPEVERPGYVAPVVINYYVAVTGYAGGKTWFIKYGTPDNGLYAHGNCTLYAYNRRKELGLPVGDHWYNAVSWAQQAANDGLTVNHTPSAGAIIQNGGGFGHVGIVESVLENGDISISEMNAYVAGGGYNIVSGRIIPAASVGQYNYIH